MDAGGEILCESAKGERRIKYDKVHLEQAA